MGSNTGTANKKCQVGWQAKSGLALLASAQGELLMIRSITWMYMIGGWDELHPGEDVHADDEGDEREEV